MDEWSIVHIQPSWKKGYPLCGTHFDHKVVVAPIVYVHRKCTSTVLKHVLAVYSYNQRRFFVLVWVYGLCLSVCLSILPIKILEPLMSNEVMYSAVLAHDTCVYVHTCNSVSQGETDQDGTRCSKGREGAYQDWSEGQERSWETAQRAGEEVRTLTLCCFTPHTVDCC